MHALGMVPLVTGRTTRLMHSALPDSPVVAPRPPNRVRLHTASILRRAADRLAGTDDLPAGYRGRWA